MTEFILNITGKEQGQVLDELIEFLTNLHNYGRKFNWTLEDKKGREIGD